MALFPPPHAVQPSIQGRTLGGRYKAGRDAGMGGAVGWWVVVGGVKLRWWQQGGVREHRRFSYGPSHTRGSSWGDFLATSEPGQAGLMIVSVLSGEKPKYRHNF